LGRAHAIEIRAKRGIAGRRMEHASVVYSRLLTDRGAWPRKAKAAAVAAGMTARKPAS
jgi:hypothetical protein